MPEAAAVPFADLLALLRAEPLALALLGTLALGLLLLALVAAGFAPWRRRPHAVKTAFATFAAALTLGALLALAQFSVDLVEAARHAVGHVQEDDARLARRLDSWLVGQRDQLSTLARDLPRGADGEAVVRRLEQHLLANLGVRSMLAADADGAVYAGVRRAANARGVQRLAASGSAAGRAWFTEPMRTGSAYMADAFAIEVTDADPVLAVSAPTGTREEPAGIVLATLAPGALGALLDVEGRSVPTEIAVLDARSNLLQASPGFGQPAADAAGAPALRFEVGARRLLHAHAGLANGWRIVSVSDLGAELAPVRRRGLAVAFALALLVAAATLAAARAVRPLSAPLRTLGQGMAGFDPARSRAVLRAPRSAPRELRSLFAEYALMQRRLTRADRTVRMQMVEESRQRRAVEAALAQRNAELTGVQNQLRALVRTDALTGVANHRALREHLKFACGASKRIGQPLSLVLVDIDRFKDYNDEYGHPAGDACLCAIADALCETARRSLDMVARHGGAQFAMVLAVTDAEHALLVAEKARAAVAKLAVEDKRNPKGVVTVTLGVATSYPGNELEPDDLLAHAGGALGTAKQAGRDCVSFATDRAPKKAPAPAAPAEPHEETVTMEGGLPGGFRR